MQRILLIGAGLSSSTLIKYLLDNSKTYNWKLVVADISKDLAKKKTGDHPNGTAIKFDINDQYQRVDEVQKADIVISMLPARLHHLVAKSCVLHKKHLVTASYVPKEFWEFDKMAKKAKVILINELGVDPGIDHMSAMKVIDRIKGMGGTLTSFKSVTGGLIAPKYDNNPWNYKFTWNPRNVIVAGQGNAQYISRGMHKYIPYHQLFKRITSTNVLDYGEFEIYPNRDSLKYREIYDLKDIPTMFRGTLRRPGFCKAWNIFVQLGATDDSYVIENSEDLTYRDFINSFLPYRKDISVEEKICRYTGIEEDSGTMYKLRWLGIFEKKKIGLKNATPAQILQYLLEQKWKLDPNDKDMIVMQHKFNYTVNNCSKQIISSLVVEGQDNTHTAMSITVGMPVAIATKLLLTGKIKATGVQIPVKKAIYDPILRELEEYGIRFIEEETEVGDNGNGF